MKSKLGLMLILSALVVTGCGPITAQPTEVVVTVPTVTPIPEGPVVKTIPTEVTPIPEGPVVVTISAEVTPIPEGPEVTEITAQPTAVAPPVVTKLPIAVPLTSPPATTPTVAVGASDVQAARDAALTYISEHYGEQAPALSLSWTEEFTPGDPLCHLASYRYTAHTEHGAEDWVVSIPYRTRPVVYQVVVTNRPTGFRWEGTVDASGQVTEQLAPDDVRAARDTALAHLSERYGEQAPAPGLTWAEERSTPDIWSGSGAYRYTAHTEHGAEDWVVKVYYPMMPPEAVVYLVTVANRATGFRWEGQVDTAGGMTELLDDVMAARDAALAYASEHYGEQAPAPGLTWTEDFIGVLISELGCGGDETFQWAYAAEHWAVVISYRFLAPKPVVYGVSVQDLAAHFYWEGEVDAAGQVTQQSPPQ